MIDDPYVYSGSTILRNRLHIRDAKLLDRVERQLVTQRAREYVPRGRFDLKHLQAIHRHLFQDIYDWAGETPRVEIAKDGHQFQFRQFIETGFADVHHRVVAADYLKGTGSVEFAEAAGIIMGDVNYVHPFREGNGRAQLQYLKQLAADAGHHLDLRRIEKVSWLEASRASHRADYGALQQLILNALAPRHPSD